MPNLRGASPVGRGDGGRSYAARAVSEEESWVGVKEETAFGGAVVDPSRFHHEDAMGILQRRPFAAGWVAGTG